MASTRKLAEVPTPLKILTSLTPRSVRVAYFAVHKTVIILF